MSDQIKKIDWNNRALFRLLWPLIVEQMLAVTMGIADTVMVTSAGEAAVSGVSIVDAINILLVIAFGAMATGGSVVVSQYIGRRDERNAGRAAQQLMMVNLLLSLAIMGAAIAFYRPVLHLVYGQLDPDVMAAAQTYFFLSTFSYPFLAVYNAAAALYRAVGNSRVPMLIALLVNLLNIGGNAVFIYGLGIGVAGVAIATLVSRITAAVILSAMLFSRRAGAISLAGIHKTRLEWAMIRRILKIGVPSGLESSMFQFGKILLARVITSFGTAAIAANAICGSITGFIYMPGQGFGLGLLTVVGQCVGARDYEGARFYTGKLMKLTYGVVIFFNLMIIIFMEPLIGVFNLTAPAYDFARSFLSMYGIASMIAWPCGFTLPHALRAAGDARYCMIVAGITMWTVRICAAFLLCYTFGMGPIGVWYGMAGDFFARGICYVLRWRGGKWKEQRVI
jgi:putative MATE family efflux protein